MAAVWLAVFLPAAAAEAKEIPYAGSGLRDPFENLDPLPAQEKAGPAAKGFTPVLEGVLWNTEPPRAIISGQIVQVGSRVGTAEVIKIEKHGVTLVYNGKETLLSRKGEMTK
ncbi:MAG: hypothetical protein A3D28_05445 [Omnitrophica bacterium RIFCSPHIGHO2_02_FULL_63_14]|nr:MAG: hypothetical protein A3D28_05445 [Omnitrophica bacterium RIFCSPHIGHO2_02_FULL_63_14]